jgi:hypothetical protein
MTVTVGTDAADRLLEAIANLSRHHREHEKYYASAPREQAVQLQRHARSLLALADQWSEAVPSTRSVLSPFEGAPDLNSGAAVQLDGVLFMEGEGEPAEITHLKRDLRTIAADAAEIGDWLSVAMDASWAMAASLVELDGLADVLGDRHRIIANDWQAASLSNLAGKIVARVVDVLDTVDFTPAALRADLAGERVAARRLYSAAEMLNHAADLFSESAGLDNDNERRWRTFRSRVLELLGRRAPVEGRVHAGGAQPPPGDSAQPPP